LRRFIISSSIEAVCSLLSLIIGLHSVLIAYCFNRLSFRSFVYMSTATKQSYIPSESCCSVVSDTLSNLPRSDTAATLY
jgi:hypothetical protein